MQIAFSLYRVYYELCDVLLYVCMRMANACTFGLVFLCVYVCSTCIGRLFEHTHQRRKARRQHKVRLQFALVRA